MPMPYSVWLLKGFAGMEIGKMNARQRDPPAIPRREVSPGNYWIQSGLRGFAAVRGAAALALAGVLGLAAGIASLAAALALTRILPLAGVLAGIVGDQRGGAQLGAGVVGRRGCLQASCISGHESGDGCAGEECFVVQ